MIKRGFSERNFFSDIPTKITPEEIKKAIAFSNSLENLDGADPLKAMFDERINEILDKYLDKHLGDEFFEIEDFKILNHQIKKAEKLLETFEGFSGLEKNSLVQKLRVKIRNIEKLWEQFEFSPEVLEFFKNQKAEVQLKFQKGLFERFGQNPLENAAKLKGFENTYRIKLVVRGTHYRIIFRLNPGQKIQILKFGTRENIY